MDYKIQSFFIQNYKAEIINLGLPWLLPDYQGSEIENKFYFNQWMKNNNFTQYLPADKTLTDYPYLLKDGNGHSGEHVHLINHASDLEIINFDPLSTPYVCQEYISNSQEYVHHFIAENGVCIKQQTFKQVFSNQDPQKNYIRGRDIYNESIERIDLDQDHVRQINQIIKQLNFTGIGCIDFKIRNNNLYLFEINSRMGGSLVFYYHLTQDFDIFMQTLLEKVS